MPAAQMRQIRQCGFAVEEIVFKHPVEIVIDEERPVGQEKRGSLQHVVDRLQPIGKLGAQGPALGGPFPDTAFSKLPLLVANEHRAFDQRAFGDHVGIVHFKPYHLHLALDVTRENDLNSLELFREQVEREPPIDVPRDLLAQVRHVADPALPVDEAGDRVAGSLRRCDDRRAVMKGDVAQLEGNVMVFQDVPDRNAERRPGKLNQREPVVYMTKGVRNCKVGEIVLLHSTGDRNQPSHAGMFSASMIMESKGGAYVHTSSWLYPLQAQFSLV